MVSTCDSYVGGILIEPSILPLLKHACGNAKKKEISSQFGIIMQMNSIKKSTDWLSNCTPLIPGFWAFS